MLHDDDDDDDDDQVLDTCFMLQPNDDLTTGLESERRRGATSANLEVDF